MTSTQLKTIRASLGWSQQRLAEEVCVYRNTVNRWEMGLHPISPMAEKLIRTITPRAR
jgi:DNA-binding transcriptional regulator YiaG